jgi:hypothetical protein
MNNFWFYRCAIGSLAIALTSCGDGNKSTTSISKPIAVIPTASVPLPAIPIATTVPPTTSTSATVDKKSVPAVITASIASTDGDKWARTVSKGRFDPFATLALQPVAVVEKNPLAPKGMPPKVRKITEKSVSIESSVYKPFPTKVTSNPITGNGKITKGSVFSFPKTANALPEIAVTTKPTRSKPTTIANSKVLLPANSKTKITDIAAKSKQVAAQPLEAMAVEISGVIELEGKTTIIVKLPNEFFSRYVEIGDRIANNAVLVKRVEAQESLSPVIILEEVGIEVSKKIGEKPIASPASNIIKP